MMTAPASENSSGVPFSFFVEVVNAISKIKPHKASKDQLRHNRYADTPAFKTFKRWVTALRERYSPLPTDTTAIVFRFLFPEEDVARKYGLQEARLAQYLVHVLGVTSNANSRGERLKKWNGENTLGCLGDEVAAVMSDTSHSQVSTVSVTLEQINALLAELASKCAFSDASVHNSFATTAARRSRESILTTLFASLTPAEGAVLTQIILKDLRPLLYPIPQSATHYTVALLQYKSNAVTMLTKEEAMYAWDPSGRMAVIYKTRANLEDAARGFEQLEPGDALSQPAVGTLIQIPKCVKGQGTAHALGVLRSADKVWVETKYDGERAQIHVQYDETGVPQIKIFSKSGRDSTHDRAGIHHILKEALGIQQSKSSNADGIDQCYSDDRPFKHNIIIEAEMVAFSDTLSRIDEFWRIRSLIATTAIGVRHKDLPCVPSSAEDTMESQCSLNSNASDGGTRHLALVFFDILLLDDVSLLSMSYSERRAILDRIIRVIPGYSMLAERTCINMTRPDADENARKVFSALIADHQEGAVLKADGALYNEKRWPWVKLKRDYIPGYGDVVDMALLAASWEKERARELRVPPATYTTFYFGVLTNGDAVRSDPFCRPHFEVLFTCSYGLGREKLEELNFMIKSSDLTPYLGQESTKLPYSYKLCPGLSSPAVFLQQPLLAELFGAGFTKAQGSKFYELRFPRITKVHRPSDRSWIDGTSLAEFQNIARAAVGRDRPGKAEDDWAKGIFRPDQPASPGARCPQKRKLVEALWIEKLEAADKRAVGGKGDPSKRAKLQMPEPSRKNASNENAMVVHAVGETNVGELRPRIGLPRLSSVTNLTPSTSSLSTGHAAASPLTTPHRLNPSPKRLRDPGDRTGVRSSPIRPILPLSTPSRPRTANDAMNDLADTDVPPTSHTMLDTSCRRTLDATPQSGLPLSSTIHQYLQESVVYLARPPDSPRPLWRVPSRAVIPTGNRVNTLDALLIACGWGNIHPCEWARRGVVFVDDDSDSVSVSTTATGHTVCELARRRAAVLSIETAWAKIPVFVYSTKMLAFDALERTGTGAEIEASAICRFG